MYLLNLMDNVKISEAIWDTIAGSVHDLEKPLLLDTVKVSKDVSEASMRLMIGDRSFFEVIQSERITIAVQAKEYMQLILDKYQSGISIQMVQLQGVVPPDPVSDSINELNRAKQDQETLINEAKQEYNKQIYKIEGEAQKIIAEAEGYAIERVNEANGDVALFESILKEYNKAPQITKDRLYIEAMNEILSNNSNKIIVDKDIENLVPFLDQNKIKLNYDKTNMLNYNIMLMIG